VAAAVEKGDVVGVVIGQGEVRSGVSRLKHGQEA
jgi:hypothetical protein